MKLNPAMIALLATMPADFDPSELIEDLAALYRDAYALKVAVP